MTETSSIQIQCDATLSAVPAGREVPLHVVLEVKAPRMAPRGRSQLSVVLALDASGSMQGPPLEHLVQATERLLDRLQDGDAVGMVVFSSRVSVLAPVRLLDAPARAYLRRSLRELHAEGGPRRGEVVSLARVRMILGSAPQCEILLGTTATARYHAILEQFSGESWIFDLESPGGVWVNGRTVRCHHLSHGDRIRLGEHELVFLRSGRVTSVPPSSPVSASGP